MECLKECDQSEEVLDVLEKMAKNPSGFLLLAGENGTGKSYAAKVVYNLSTPYVLPFYDEDKAIFINQADLNLNFNKRQNQFGETVTFLETMRKTKLLILDDLGTRTPTDAFMDFIYSIIDYRYNNNLATIITTNLNSKDMREKFGDAFVSRVASGKVFRFEGPDRRFKEF